MDDDEDDAGYPLVVPENSLEERLRQQRSFRDFAESVSYAGNVVPDMADEDDDDD